MNEQTDIASTGLARARLPRWCLPAGWPEAAGQPALADVDWTDGRVAAVRPAATRPPGHVDVAGAPVLPALVDAHPTSTRPSRCRAWAPSPRACSAPSRR